MAKAKATAAPSEVDTQPAAKPRARTKARAAPTVTAEQIIALLQRHNVRVPARAVAEISALCGG